MCYTNLFLRFYATCLNFFLPFLIAKNQFAFALGRDIGENISLAHELIKDFKKTGKLKMCIKIDLHNAYDMINWEFTCRMMQAMGFPTSFMNLIYECISSPTFLFLLMEFFRVSYILTRVEARGSFVPIFILHCYGIFLT